MQLCHVLNLAFTKITNQCLRCHHLFPNTNPNPNLSFSLFRANPLHAVTLRSRHDHVQPPLHTPESWRLSRPHRKPRHRCCTGGPRHLHLLRASCNQNLHCCTIQARRNRPTSPAAPAPTLPHPLAWAATRRRPPRETLAIAPALAPAPPSRSC